MILSFLLAELINGNCKFLFEKINAAEHARIQEIHLGINVKGIIL